MPLAACRATLICLLCTAVAIAQQPPAAPLDAALWQRARSEALNRPRRIIFNNDGGDAIRTLKIPTADGLLSVRTKQLVGTHVDSLFYCTKCTGLDLVTHFSKIGTVFVEKEGGYDSNKMQIMLDKGIDPLRVMAEFAKANGLEFFWSLRMNDNHDVSTAEYGIVNLRANRFKMAHPEYMFGTAKKRPKYGAWTALDYARPQVRERAYQLVEEVCLNYDIDGVDLDFFRHPAYFKSTSGGASASDQERAAMTELVARIRRMTEEVGKSRGRPILLSARTPDSVEYCRALGLDIENWLASGLIDLWMPSGSYRLNEWDGNVQLAHKYGVKVFPSLDNSRLRDEAARNERLTKLAYRARAADAWRAGADGIYLYNFPDLYPSDNSLLNELGDPKTLATLDKDYFASVQGTVGSTGNNLPMEPYLGIETLNPSNPKTLRPGKPTTSTLSLGENFATASDAQLTLRLKILGFPGKANFQTSLNNKPIHPRPTADDWFECPVPKSMLHPGRNRVTLTLPADADSPATWSDLVLQVRYGQ
ncbi:MAG: hypothetical protein IT425_14645 [Pirellulales bacterium]|nr:hypothetical protein [Pirellulales bacterium]